jgi:hypothetical protein
MMPNIYKWAAKTQDGRDRRVHPRLLEATLNFTEAFLHKVQGRYPLYFNFTALVIR